MKLKSRELKEVLKSRELKEVSEEGNKIQNRHFIRKISTHILDIVAGCNINSKNVLVIDII